jgi:sulfur carrier protein
MKITLNNSSESIEAETMSIENLLLYKKFSFRLLVIKINDNLVRRGEYARAFIKDGDKVEVIHMISGG